MADLKKRYYTVIAGNHKPQPQLLGFLKKGDGQPKPGAIEIQIAVGKIQIPNFSNVWARRIIENPSPAQSEKMKNGSLAVTDSEYRGALEFLNYGEPGGEAIDVRFLRNAKTLDKQYQEVVLKLKLQDEDVMIDLDQGLNDFDEAVAPYLVQMLKVHGRNGDSKSRNPDIHDCDFTEYSANKIKKSEVDKMAVLQTALNLVFGTDGNDDKISVLAAIMGEDSAMQPDVLFSTMVVNAKEKPDEFIGKYNRFKKEVGELLNDSVELEILDISQDGVLSYISNAKKDVLLDKIESAYKGKAMLNYVLNSLLDPTVYQAILKLKKSFNEVMSGNKK